MGLESEHSNPEPKRTPVEIETVKRLRAALRREYKRDPELMEIISKYQPKRKAA